MNRKKDRKGEKLSNFFFEGLKDYQGKMTPDDGRLGGPNSELSRLKKSSIRIELFKTVLTRVFNRWSFNKITKLTDEIFVLAELGRLNSKKGKL